MNEHEIHNRLLYKKIINALRSGNVPYEGTQEILVAREKLIGYFDEQFEELLEGASNFKFLKGDYGSGKTFICHSLKELAERKNLLVSLVVIGKETPFNDLSKIYHAVIQGIKIKKYGTVPAFEKILENWIDNAKSKEHFTHTELMMDIDKVLKEVRLYNQQLATAIKAYCMNYYMGNMELANTAMSFIKGELNIDARLKRQLELTGKITKDTAKDYLMGINRLIKEMGYGGFLIIFDEFELIRSITRKDLRDDSYNNIRQLIDDVSSGAGNSEGMYVVFAGTGSVFSDDVKGIPSYSALNDRIKTDSVLMKKGFSSFQEKIVVLEGFGFDEFKLISNKLKNIYEVAYNCELTLLTDEFIDKFLEQLLTKFGQRSKQYPRSTIREIIGILDMMRENPDFDPEVLLANDSMAKISKKIQDEEQKFMVEEEEFDKEDFKEDYS